MAEKQVMVVAADESEHSAYALEWTLEHFVTPFGPNTPFKLVIVHAKPMPSSVVGLSGPGAAEVLPIVDADLRKQAARVCEKAKEFCASKSYMIVIELHKSRTNLASTTQIEGLQTRGRTEHRTRDAKREKEKEKEKKITEKQNY